MINDARDALREGRMVLLYDSDDREGETDIVFPAMAVGPAEVARMRSDGGGLICVAIHPDAAHRLGLPFYSDILKYVGHNGFNAASAIRSMVEQEGDVPYDRRSSFSLWVNHRRTFTGITDRDRSLTIGELGRAVDRVLRGEAVDFGREFRSPGHVSVLRAADRLVHERIGQTELSVALAQLAGITPAMAICEMLDTDTGRALSKEDAKAYAKSHGAVFLEGKDILGCFRT